MPLPRASCRRGWPLTCRAPGLRERGGPCDTLERPHQRLRPSPGKEDQKSMASSSRIFASPRSAARPSEPTDCAAASTVETPSGPPPPPRSERAGKAKRRRRRGSFYKPLSRARRRPSAGPRGCRVEIRGSAGSAHRPLGRIDRRLPPACLLG